MRMLKVAREWAMERLQISMEIQMSAFKQTRTVVRLEASTT